MKIEKGMYVRTTDGYTDKVLGFDSLYKQDDTVILEKEHYLVGFIKSASFNIIDLVEVGDYVNGYLVNEIITFKDDSDWRNGQKYADVGVAAIFEHNIRDVLTHEQFNKIKFKVVQA